MKWFVALGIFLAVFGVAVYFGRLGIELESDGTMLKPAMDVAAGKILFKETYFHYGALTAYFNAIILTIFGKKLIVLKIATAVAYGLTGVVMWLLGRKIIGSIWALFIVALWLVLAPYYIEPFYPWPSVYGDFFHTLSVYVCVETVTKKRAFWLGVISAMAFWCKQPFLVLLVALVALVRKKELYIGFFIVSTVILGYILATGATRDFWYQSVRAGYANGRIVGEQFLKNGIAPLWLLLALSCLVVTIKNHNKLGMWSWVSLISFVQYYPLADYSHMYWAATPAFILFGYAIKKNLAILIIILMLVIPEIGIRIAGAKEKILTSTAIIESPEVLRGMKVSPEKKMYLEALDKTLQNHDKIVLLGYDSLISTFNDHFVSIGPMYADFSGLSSGFYNYKSDLEKYIETNKPFVVKDYGEILLLVVN